MELVDAYLARRALDYLVGFTPVAGACGACHLAARDRPAACSRWPCAWYSTAEIEIEQFKTQEYWTVDADVSGPASDPFLARLRATMGKRSFQVRPQH